MSTMHRAEGFAGLRRFTVWKNREAYEKHERVPHNPDSFSREKRLAEEFFYPQISR